MSTPAKSLTAESSPTPRLEVLFEELSELAGQRNAIDGRIVQIAAEIEGDGLWGATGARSVAALIAQWKRDHDTHDDTDDDAAVDPCRDRPPMPTFTDAFMSLVEAGWDTEVALRPHGHRTTVVLHLDVKDRVAALHLGPALTDADHRYLTCDATCEVSGRHRTCRPTPARSGNAPTGGGTTPTRRQTTTETNRQPDSNPIRRASSTAASREDTESLR
jgi:Domain of unknown function (DUF222)